MKSGHSCLAVCISAVFLFDIGSLPLQCFAAPPAEYLIGYMGVGGSGSEIAHVLGLIRPDGTHEQYPDFKQPEQKSWVFGPQFSDGRRIILCSYEDVGVAQVRSGKVVTHDWIYDLQTGVLAPTM